MLKETRVIFSLEELTALRAECGACGGEVVYPCDSPMPLPQACPLCREPWARRSAEGSLERDFLQALRLMLRQENPAVKLRFEMPSPPNPPTHGQLL